MAFEEYDDFEQEQLVKDWIKNNWLTMATGLVLGLGGVFGFNYWKDQKQIKRFEIATQYESFSEILNLSELDDAQKLLTELENKSGASFYTHEGHLLLAKEFVKKNELKKAITELEKLLNSNPDNLLTELVSLRMARIYNEMENYDEALKQTTGITIESFLSIAKEIEGDALFAKGEKDKAITAYKEAVSKGNGYSGKKNIEMKLENS